MMPTRQFLSASFRRARWNGSSAKGRIGGGGGALLKFASAMKNGYGTTTATGPGSPQRARANAWRTPSGICSILSILKTPLVTCCSRPTLLIWCTWKEGAIGPWSTSQTITTSGTLSSSASAMPLRALVTPGPGTRQTTPTLPVARA